MEVPLDAAELRLLNVHGRLATLLQPLDPVFAQSVGDGRMDRGGKREPESRPRRPEVTMRGHRPDTDEEREQDDRRPNLNRQPSAAERDPPNVVVLENRDHPARDPDDKRERE